MGKQASTVVSLWSCRSRTVPSPQQAALLSQATHVSDQTDVRQQAAGCSFQMQRNILHSCSSLQNMLHSCSSRAHLVLLLLGFLLLGRHLAEQVQVLVIIVAVRASCIAETTVSCLRRLKCATSSRTGRPCSRAHPAIVAVKTCRKGKGNGDDVEDFVTAQCIR